MDEKQKILIVADQKENLVTLRRVLNAATVAEIVEAASGDEALLATLDHSFTVAILDFMMSEMDGCNLAEQLRSNPKTRNIPIIFLTGVYSEEAHIFKGYEAGPVDYIIKPYHPGMLCSKVHVFLDLHRAHAELAEKIVALTASEERFRSLVITIPDIVYRIDTEGRFTFLNDAVNSLGYTPEELLGSHFSQIMLPADECNVRRDVVLPEYRGRNTGPEDAPKLFDERRAGKRKTMGMQMNLVPRRRPETDLAELHSQRPNVITVEINSAGIYVDIPDRSRTVFIGTVGVIRDITERKRLEAELKKYRGDLEKIVRDRVREQACLYDISEVLAKPHHTVDDALNQVVNLVPPGLQYPDIACARLRLDLITVTSEPFRESPSQLVCDILVAGRIRGAVEVFYMEDRPTADQGPFLIEEKNLMSSIARVLGQFINRMETNARETQLNAVLSSIRNINSLIIREKRPDRLIQKACDALIASRGFNGAWIVLTDNPLMNTMKFASSGFEEGFFSSLETMLREGRLPACCRSTRAQKSLIVTDIPEGACRACPVASGYRENVPMTTELRHNNHGYGWLTVSVPKSYAADPEETSLLSEIAGDIAFAIHTMEIEKKREISEETLADSELRYRRLFESAKDGILILNADTGKVTDVNPFLVDLLGFSYESFLGKAIWDLGIFNDIIANLDKFIELQKKEYVRYEHLPLKTVDGRIIEVEFVSNVYEIKHRKVIQCNIRDITERRKEEKNREVLQEQLLQSQKLEAVGRLSAGIAHDFNNILTTIIGNAEMVMMDTEKDDHRREMVKEIIKAAEKAAGLIRQLLIFSRKQILQPMVLNLNVIVKDLEKMLRRIIGEDIELRINLAPDLGQVEVDISQIEQVIMNLCVNAKDAMPKGGHLTIETRNVDLDEEYAKTHLSVTPGPYVMLAVSDSGTGMAPEVLSHIFQPYFTTKEQSKGTGLGLSTIYGIVNQNKGNIYVYSEPGKGSVFKIYLPECEKTSLVPKELEKNKSTLQGSETVLVVEDNEMVRKTTVKTIQRYGYTVLIAPDGGEALRICGEHDGPIHLMLTDVVMPGMGGRHLAERAQVMRADMKVLFMSGYTDDAIVHHGVIEKGIAFLQKPFTAERLARKIREVMNG
jgi:PAS domain S-box-containing protein